MNYTCKMDWHTKTCEGYKILLAYKNLTTDWSVIRSQNCPITKVQAGDGVQTILAEISHQAAHRHLFEPMVSQFLGINHWEPTNFRI